MTGGNRMDTRTRQEAPRTPLEIFSPFESRCKTLNSRYLVGWINEGHLLTLP